MHREDGPAAIRADGSLEYWFRGERLAIDGQPQLDVQGYTIWLSGGRITVIDEPDDAPPRAARGARNR